MLNSKTLILTSTYPADLSPPNSSHHRLRRRITTILHITSLVSSLIAISLFSAAVPRWNANFFHNTGPTRGDWTDAMPLGPLTFAVLYHCSVLGYHQAQKSRKFSSGASASAPSLSRRSLLIHTTVPTLVLLSLLPSLFLAGYGSLFRYWQPAVRNQSGILVCSMLNVFAKECAPVLYLVGSLQIAGIVFGTLVWALHFTLLLVAFRNLRRYMLVKQLQREKLAQYASEEQRGQTSHSHGSGRGRRDRKGSGSSKGSRGHREWPQNPHRRDGSGSRSGSNTGDERRITAETQTQGQDVPIYFVQPPAETHPPVSHRYG